MVDGLNAQLACSPSSISDTKSVNLNEVVVDIGAWTENALFDLGGQLTIGRDLGAIMSQGKVHPSLATFKKLFDWVQIYYLQFRRSPTLLVKAVESVPGFTGYDCVMPVPDVHGLVLERIAEERKDGGEDNLTDFGTCPSRPMCG